MDLKIKSAWIFLGILLLLFFCSIFSTPSFILLATLIGSLLIVFQVIIVLKDESDQ
ncbi:MAG: hypothetical protein AAF573_15650 [Bacteroidota bacterium]